MTCLRAFSLWRAFGRFKISRRVETAQGALLLCIFTQPVLVSAMTVVDRVSKTFMPMAMKVNLMAEGDECSCGELSVV